MATPEMCPTCHKAMKYKGSEDQNSFTYGKPQVYDIWYCEADKKIVKKKS